MKKWFMNLSRAGKIGLVSVAAVGVLITGSAATQPAKKVEQCKASEKITTETVAIPFEKTQTNDANMDKGRTAISTAGANGEKVVTEKTTSYTPAHCKPATTVSVKEETTKQPVAEVTSVGTKEVAVTPPPQPPKPNCSPYYSPCVPNVSYDLDCPDVGMRVSVHGGDPYRLDADHDGIGCESY